MCVCMFMCAWVGVCEYVYLCVCQCGFMSNLAWVVIGRLIGGQQKVFRRFSLTLPDGVGASKDVSSLSPHYTGPQHPST